MAAISLDEIQKKLNGASLPGEIGHHIMLPQNARGATRPRQATHVTSRNSAVMALLTPGKSSELDLIFTLRSTKLRSHSGQISFPGGKIDPDESPQEAAKRETREEIGIAESNVQVLGNLSKIYVPPSNSDIHPFIGYTEQKPTIASPEEVEEIFTVPLAFLADRGNIRTMNRIFDGVEYKVPYFDVHHKVPLWGATAIILGELIALLD
ncbi:MAG: CoA pyrophosphatase [Candidatus Kapaibacteriales bacterium]